MHNVSKIAAVMCLALNTSMVLAEQSKGTNKLMADTAGTAQISVDHNSGYARFIRLEPTPSKQRASRSGSSKSAVKNEASSIEFLRNYGSAFGISDVDSELAFVKTNNGASGSKHSVFAQRYQGIPVFAGEIRTHFNAAGEMIAVNGKFLADIKAPTSPIITSDAARVIAINTVKQDPTQAITEESLANSGNREEMRDKPAVYSTNGINLSIFRAGLAKGTPGLDHLVYEVEVVNNTGSVREFVYVDAMNGAVVDQITGSHDALERRAFDAEGAAHPGPNYSNNPYWVEGQALPTGNVEADNMIYASEDTYNFFANAFGQDSFDSNGATMDAIFNRGDSCPNASWNGTYISFCAGLTTDDVTAHEWGHAYTQYTNNLIYQWQSGALNESYSDIWGETVDLINGRDEIPDAINARTDGSCAVQQGGSDDSVRWLLGEDSTAPGLTGALRDMWNPNCAGDPGKVSDTQYHCATSDNGGVHINSGVPNHAFTLMVDGGTFNGYSDTGLGLTKSAHIHYLAQQALTPSSNFYDHADSLEMACDTLTGVNLDSLTDGSPTGEMITVSDCDQVGAIIEAVELRSSPVEQCGFEPILAEAPALCLGNGEVATFFSEDFESGALPAGWTVSSHDVANPNTFDSPGWLVDSDLPPGATGTFAMFAPDLIAGDCAADTEAGVVNMDSPEIVLPASDSPRVAFDHWVAAEEGWDGGNLKISVNGGAFVLVPAEAYSFNPYNGAINAGDNPLAGQVAFTGADEGGLKGSWGQSQVSLFGLAQAGDTIKLRFDFGTDGCNGTTGWYVDSLQGYSCADEVAPICGDGVLNLGEMCDDANSASGDGCSSTCQIEEGFVCSAPAGPVDSTNVIADWSFEGGVPNEDWLAESTFGGIAGFPLCGTGNGCPAVPKNTGDWVVWVGGLAGVQSSVTQDVVIPAAATDITLELLVGLCDSPQDFIQVLIDGNEIGRVECTATNGAYATHTYSVAGFNDNASHSLQIGGIAFGANGTHSNFFIDDIILEDNTPKPGAASICINVVADIACNVAPVAFESGIPGSWNVVNNAGGAIVWSTIAGSGIGGNYTGGTGDAASVSSDASPGAFDTELHSNAFSLAGMTEVTLEYLVDYQNYGFLDFLNLDISTDGGNSWTNLMSWNEDHPAGGLFNATGEEASVDLSHYAGETNVKLRWHYFDPNPGGDWDWYAQIDDVALVCNDEPQEALRCDVDMNGSVDRNDTRMIMMARNQAAQPGDPRDNDGDGVITMSDARQCMQVCTLPRCAPVAPN